MITIKKFILIFVIMLFNNICSSYTTYIDKPNGCSNFPSHFIYPVGSIECRFLLEQYYPFEEELANCSIYLVQNGSEHLMFTGVVHTGQWISMPVIPTNFPGFCFNEIASLRIKLSSYSFPNFHTDFYGYFIIHKTGYDCHFGSLTNGTPVLNLNNVPGTFFRTSSCNPVSSSGYFVKQYKVNFTLYGDFNDSIPEVDTNLSWGYNGALPNYQRTWAAKIYQSATETRFILFVYKLTNILGQELDWAPCSPENAAVAYYYVKRPVIQQLDQYPSPINPGNPSALIVCRLQQGNGNLTYEWRDSNRTPSIEFQQVGNFARVTKNFYDNNNEPRLRQYEVFCRAGNQLGFSGWKSLVVQFSVIIPQCPVIKFREQGISIDENSILPGSTDFKSKDIMDSYLLMNPFLAQKGKIEFTIHETGDYNTRIDQIGLLQVLADPGEEIAVEKDGGIINYHNDADKTTVLMNDKDDISGKIYYNDDKEVELKENDKLKVSFIPDGSGFVVMLFRSPLNKDNIAGSVISNGIEAPFYCRDNNNFVCIRLNKDNLGEFEINAKQDVTINQIAVVKNLNTFNYREINPESAVINSKDVRKLLSSSDDNYAFVSKDSELNLTFANDAVSDKTVRYILKTEGRSDKPAEDHPADDLNDPVFTNRLFDNSPNPFNPITKIIFEIRNDGPVSLKLYDVTGKELRTLVSGFRKAGRYDLTFDGSSLSSGIYFYRINSGNYTEAKRMILIK